jgi:hypothetical protein
MRNSFTEVLHKIIGLGRRVEGNPDIKEIIMKIEEEFRKFHITSIYPENA